MIEPGNDDLIAGIPEGGDSPAHGERQRRHIRAEDDLIGIASSEEIGHRPLGLGDNLIAFPAGDKTTAMIGVVIGKMIRNSIDDALRHLAAGGAVEVYGGLTVDDSGKGGELLTRGRED